MSSYSSSRYTSHKSAAAIAPSDTANLPIPVTRLYVGVGGTLKVDTESSVAVSFTVVAGQQLDLRVKKVYATGTTATNLAGSW